jgi:hypothetical protein
MSVDIPIACSLDNIDLARRSEQVKRDVFSGAEERIELEDGYSFRFPGNDDWKPKIEEFIASERRCCSFFRFEVTYEAGLGPIWLRLTGPAGTKQFIEAAFVPV